MPISDLSKEQIEQYAKESTNWKELMTKCGYTNFGCRTYLKRKLELFEINILHFIRVKSNKRYTDEEIFKENSEYTSMFIIKNKLIKKYNWKYECSSCKLSEWLGQQIPIEIDHINGNHSDNRFENLRFLCPNCHALTDTYKGKNIKNKEHNSNDNDNNNKNINKCIDCNKLISNKSVRCKLCHCALIKSKTLIKNTNKCIDCNKQIYNNASRCVECHLINSRKVERPTYEELLKDKETLSMVKIGKKYNVSDNTIRKWIKKYQNINNLPIY